MSIELPPNNSRTVLVGSTGSGKTQFGMWFLSTRDYRFRPWFILDYKGEKSFKDLEAKGAIDFPLDYSELPEEAGIYIIRILPNQEALVSRFFQDCYLQENVGVFIDEGTMTPKNDPWLRACLTQGRSKEIELIICTQRPVWLDKYVFTEASFFGIFRLSSLDDRKAISNYLGGVEPNSLEPYHCLWYMVNRQEYVIFQPVPPMAKIIASFNFLERRNGEEESGVKIL